MLNVLEMTALLERGDLKQELMKELERQLAALKALTKHQEIDHSKLDLILSKQKHALDRLHTLDGKLGEHLKRNDFLIGTGDRGLARLRDNAFSFFGNRPGITPPIINTLFRDSRGNIWIGTDGNGLSRLTPGRLYHLYR